MEGWSEIDIRAKTIVDQPGNTGFSSANLPPEEIDALELDNFDRLAEMQFEELENNLHMVIGSPHLMVVISGKVA